MHDLHTHTNTHDTNIAHEHTHTVERETEYITVISRLILLYFIDLVAALIRIRTRFGCFFVTRDAFRKKNVDCIKFYVYVGFFFRSFPDF